MARCFARIKICKKLHQSAKMNHFIAKIFWALPSPDPHVHRRLDSRPLPPSCSSVHSAQLMATPLAGRRKTMHCGGRGQLNDVYSWCTSVF